jgi:hypothetical protein
MHKKIDNGSQMWNPVQSLLLNTITQLKSQQEWIFKPADKNLGLCILSKEDYIKMCLLHLNTNSYQQLNSTKTYYFLKRGFSKLRLILNQFNQLYDQSKRKSDGSVNTSKLSVLATSLLQLENSTSLKHANFYCLPKMHKKIDNGSLPPSRPIVSSIDSMTYHASIYIHNSLKPLLDLLPTICKSSKQVILQTRDLFIPENAIILCADVSNL